MSDQLQQHLDKSLYGAPKINPEEQAKYLGTFRERCLLSMTKSEMQNPKLNLQPLEENERSHHND